MSATLEGGPVAALLGGAAVVTSEGRAHPVEVRHLARRGRNAGSSPPWRRRCARRSRPKPGDVLVFLPGAGEIRRVEALLRGVAAEVIPLHGNLPPEQQDRAILPSPPGSRKVVLATSIAETSLTIEGVRVVVDAGLSRVPRYSPRTGMTRLATVRVSRASAEQRRGRAGRLAPGVCYRLWSRQEDAALPERPRPRSSRPTSPRWRSIWRPRASAIRAELRLARSAARRRPSRRHGLCSPSSARSIAPAASPATARR